MPFSSTVKGTVYFGNGMKRVYGEWTGSSGDTAGTLTVSGPYVVGFGFYKLEGGNTSQIFPRVDISTSGFIATLTVQNQDDVATGRFWVDAIGQ